MRLNRPFLTKKIMRSPKTLKISFEIFFLMSNDNCGIARVINE